VEKGTIDAFISNAQQETGKDEMLSERKTRAF